MSTAHSPLVPRNSGANGDRSVGTTARVHFR